MPTHTTTSQVRENSLLFDFILYIHGRVWSQSFFVLFVFANLHKHLHLTERYKTEEKQGVAERTTHLGT